MREKYFSKYLIIMNLFHSACFIIFIIFVAFFKITLHKYLIISYYLAFSLFSKLSSIILASLIEKTNFHQFTDRSCILFL